MSVFGKLFGAAVDVVMLPVEVVKDVATLGGVITDHKEPYTISRLKDTQKLIDAAIDEASE